MILADAELELVPAQIQGHPAIRSYAKKRGRSPAKILLDSSYHHPALKRVEQGERRGRPDIVHFFLLLCLDSILNIEGQLETIVHTRNNDVIRASREIRLPKNYFRFIGLMEDLFQRKFVPSEEEPLLTLESGRALKDLVAEKKSLVIALAHEAKPVNIFSYFKRIKKDVTCIVGGFPHGDFISPVHELADQTISIHREPLKSWTVVSEALVAYAESLRRKG